MIINNLDPDIDELIQLNEISVEKFGKIHISTDVFYPASATYKLISDLYIKNKQYINNLCIENKQFVIDTYANVQLDLDNKADIVHYHNLSDIYGFETNSTLINSLSNSFKYKKCNVDGSNERFSFGFTINRFVPFFNTLPSLFNVNNSNDTTAYVKLWVGGNGVHSTMGDTITTSGGSPGGDINVCFQDAFYIVARTAYKGAYMVVPFEITEDIDAENSFIKLRLYANAGSATNDMCFGWSMFAISKDDIRNIYTGSGIALTQDMVTTIIDPEYVKYSSYITRKIDRHIPANSYVFLCFTANPYFIDDSSKDIKKIYNQYITTNGYDNDKIILKVFENTGYRWFNGGTFLYFHDVSLCIKTIVDKDDLTGDDKTNLTLQDVITDLNSRLAFLESKNRMEIDSALLSLNTRVDQLDTNVNSITSTVDSVNTTINDLITTVENVNNENYYLNLFIEYLTSSIVQPENSSLNKALLRSVEFKPSLFGIKDDYRIRDITLNSNENNKNNENNIVSCYIEITNSDNSVSARSNIIEFSSNSYLTFNFDPLLKIKNSNDFYSIKLFNQANNFLRVRIALYDFKNNSNPLSDDTYVTWLNGTLTTELKNWVACLSTNYYKLLLFTDDIQTTISKNNNKPVSSGAVYNALKQSSYWSNIVEELEDCSPDDFNMTNLTYIGDNESLTKLGTTDNHVMYKFDANDDQSARNIVWNILGYNATVPEYIKYKDESGNKVFVKSLKNELLSTIAINDPIYTKVYNSEYMKNLYQETNDTIESIGSETFNYGNNIKYAVPMTIVAGGTTYTFCGYNITLLTKYLVNDSCATNEKIISIPWCLNNFSTNNLSNVWSNSNIRSWLNDKNHSSAIKVFNSIFLSVGEYEISSFMSRMTNDYGFIENVLNIVNKTWVHNDFRNNLTVDSNNCQHTVDKFWLLDNGQINGNYLNHYSDNNYTTSKLSSIFNNDNSRKKYMIDIDGNKYGDDHFNSMYWLRSASNNSNKNVGIISYDGGSVSESDVNNSGIYTTIAPACTIG